MSRAERAAARLSRALRPGASLDGVERQRRALSAHIRYAGFAEEVLEWQGSDALDAIVATVEQHAAITKSG